MAYVDVPFEPSDPDAMLADALDTLEQTVPGYRPRKTQVVYAALAENARMNADTRALAADVPDAIFRVFGGKLAGIPALPGTPATGTAVFTVEQAGQVVPAGTTVAWSADPTDPTVEAVEFTTGSAVAGTTPVAGGFDTTPVQIVADTVGELGNDLPAGSLLLADPLVFVLAVRASTVSAGGTDPEDDLVYLDRLADTLGLSRRIPVLARDFAVLARSVPGVQRALAIDNFSSGINERQTITVSSATGGTFTLTFEGQTTTALTHNALAVVVRDALVALSNVAPGDVVVTGGPLGTTPVTVEFTGFLQESDRTQMTAASTLTGAGAAVSTATAVQGVLPQTSAERTVSVAALDALGQPIGPSVKAALDALLQDEREVNFIVRVFDATTTPITVTFAGQAQPGADPALVRVDAEQSARDFLSAALWAGGRERPPVWRRETLVRYLDVAAVLGSTPGLLHLTSLALNGSTADVTLAGQAPVPLPTVTGTVAAAP